MKLILTKTPIYRTFINFFISGENLPRKRNWFEGCLIYII